VGQSPSNRHVTVSRLPQSSIGPFAYLVNAVTIVYDSSLATLCWCSAVPRSNADGCPPTRPSTPTPASWLVNTTVVRIVPSCGHCTAFYSITYDTSSHASHAAALVSQLLVAFTGFFNHPPAFIHNFSLTGRSPSLSQPKANTRHMLSPARFPFMFLMSFINWQL
jgi:hypothetical protein